MKKGIRRKLHSKRAFTLAETLLTVLILLLVSAVVATGIPAAKNAYEKVVLASNAEVLLSTTISTLRNELGTAEIILTSGDDPISVYTGVQANNAILYYSEGRNSYSTIFKDPSDNDAMHLQRYTGYDPISGEISADGMGMTVKPERIISEQTATNGLYATYGTVSYSGGIVRFTDLAVKQGSTVLASRENLSIRVISYTED